MYFSSWQGWHSTTSAISASKPAASANEGDEQSNGYRSAYKDNIEGKVIVIKPDVLRPEYRYATHQLKLCVGGFGAHGNSRGNACFCVDLRSGNHSRFERRDVLGTLDKSALPDWAKQGLEKARQEETQKRPKAREDR